jgi:hypothetical protein
VHVLLASWSYQSSRRITELGLLVALVGGLAVAGAGRSRFATGALAGLLIAVGLGLVILAVHFGVSPYRRR